MVLTQNRQSDPDLIGPSQKQMNQPEICPWTSNGARKHKLESRYFLIGKEIDIMLISDKHLTHKNHF